MGQISPSPEDRLDRIVILDFGGQTSLLISRRIREIGIFTEVFPGQSSWEEICSGQSPESIKGIIFSGSPYSLTNENSVRPDPSLYQTGLPVLGICYGTQCLIHDHGGSVGASSSEEYGSARIEKKEDSAFLSGIPSSWNSWMSHGDSILTTGESFEILAESEYGLPAILKHKTKPFFGVQFHPEVSHGEYGNRFLENFAVSICKAKKEWTLEQYSRKLCRDIRDRVQDRPVLLLISGGVDSAVVAALLLKSLPPSQVYLMYIDTGLMRLDESLEVKENLKSLGASEILCPDRSETFLTALQGVSSPEEKRRIIGDTFVQVQEEEIKNHISGTYLLAQGTLYTDMIESGKGVGQHSHLIKSHHNVSTPLIQDLRRQGLVLEPLSLLYKDEVRRLGSLLGLKKSLLHRHPFPGPGLGIRILGEVTRESCDLLRRADDIYLKELKKRNLYDEIWQAFAVLLPSVKTVGVTGDTRKYAYTLGLRAVEASDGMTAKVYPFRMDDLLEISSAITNRIPQIGRVVYDISSKPPATIEWE